MNKLWCLFILILTSIFCHSQTKKSLEECIRTAVVHNIDVADAFLNEEYIRLQYEQSKNYWMPTVNLSLNPNYNIGYSVDPTTYQYENVNSISGSGGANVEFKLYEGNKNLHLKNKYQYDLIAAGYTKERLKRNVIETVCNYYFEILLAKKVLNEYENQWESSKALLNKTNELISIGQLSSDKALEMEVQCLRSESTIVSQKGHINFLSNRLKMYLKLPDTNIIDVEEFSHNKKPIIEDLADTIHFNYTHFPSYMEEKYRLLSLKKSVFINKSSFRPLITFGYSIGSNFINTSRTPITESKENLPIGYLNDVNRSTVFSLYSQNVLLGYSNNSAFNQLYNNLQQRIGLTLQVPIFDKKNKSTLVKLSELDFQKQKLKLDKSEQFIKETIFGARINLRNAYEKLMQVEKRLQSERKLHKNIREKYSLGLIPYFEVRQNESELLKTEIEYRKCEYDFLLKQQILNINLHGNTF